MQAGGISFSMLQMPLAAWALISMALWQQSAGWHNSTSHSCSYLHKAQAMLACISQWQQILTYRIHPQAQHMFRVAAHTQQ
jgi:hypothetical protein